MTNPLGEESLSKLGTMSFIAFTRKTLLRLLGVALVLPTVNAAPLQPLCQSIAPSQRNLTNVKTATTTLPDGNLPFGIVYATYQPKVAFVALNHSLGVLDTSTFAPTLRHQIPFPASARGPLDALGGVGGTGLALTHDGRYVLVTAFSSALIVFDAARAAKNQGQDSVVAVLAGATSAGDTAIEVTVSPDDRYAYVSQENGVETVTKEANGTTRYSSQRGRIETFALHPPAHGCEEAQRFHGESLGFQELGYAVVGTQVSQDGRLLYATSEQKALNDTHGFVSVLSTQRLQHNSSNAELARVDAGCEPVRALLSPDGKQLWVTARSSNALLAFDAGRLISGRNDSLLANVQVGTQPVGLSFVKDHSRIVVANSDRSSNAQAYPGLSVVNVRAALRGKEGANLGQIAADAFPRELAASADGRTLLVSEYAAGRIRAVDVDSLP